jgi:hypothetical protein
MIVEVGSTSYEMWESLPIPMYMKLFYFNVTNAEDLTARVPGITVRFMNLDKCLRMIIFESLFTPRVNFTNILRTAFAPVRLRQ